MELEKDFVITGIDSVILVDKNKYPGYQNSFGQTLYSNELIFHLSGHITVYYNDNVFEISPNTVRFLPKGPNTRYDVERREHGDCIDIFFQADRPIAADALIMDVSRKQHLGGLFKKIFFKWVEKNSGYRFECISLLYQIFAELQKNTYLPERQLQMIQPAVDYINDNFLHCRITAKELTDIAGISYTYLNRLFQEKFGKSPAKYIIWLKLNYACELLLTNIYTVTQISEICGFSDVGFFSRQFKAFIGISPTQYIKKYKS